MKIDIFLSNQIKIARQTLLLSDLGASIPNNMTRDEAIEVLTRHRNRNRNRNRYHYHYHNL